MRVEQAIHTSLATRGRAGYHIVARSPGINDEAAREIAARSPSNGALIVDDFNIASLNFFPLRDGRFGLSRTSLGPPEYSGRGESCLYTHAIVVERGQLDFAHYHVSSLYRDALALGHLTYRPTNGSRLGHIELSDCHSPARAGRGELRDVLRKQVSSIGGLIEGLSRNQPISMRVTGDRIAALEELLAILPPEVIRGLSVSTSLVPSSSRGYVLSLTG